MRRILDNGWWRGLQHRRKKQKSNKMSSHCIFVHLFYCHSGGLLTIYRKKKYNLLSVHNMYRNSEKARKLQIYRNRRCKKPVLFKLENSHDREP